MTGVPASAQTTVTSSAAKPVTGSGATYDVEISGLSATGTVTVNLIGSRQV
jgi:hypothetical protein